MAASTSTATRSSGASGPCSESQNALFAGSDEGGDKWAVIATLIEVCKLNGVNPHVWLTVTLSKLAAGHSANQLAELMPWTDVA